MKLKIEWIETKSQDWKVGTFKDSDGLPYDDASINRIDKKGKVFPNFDNLAPGQEIEGNPWQNPTSKKWTIYPPDEEKKWTGGGGVAKNMERKEQGVAKAQERKEEGIEKAQANHSNGVKTASTMRDAVLLATTEFNGNGGFDLKERVLFWRKWLLDNWELNG